MHSPKIKKSYLHSLTMDKSAYKEFLNSNETLDWGNKYYKQWGTDYLCTSQKIHGLDIGVNCQAPIESFCGYGYLSENEFLRSNKNSKCSSGLTDVLIRAICSAPVIPENIIVYRLVCDEVIQELTTIRDDKPYAYYEYGFMSTSMLKSIVDMKEPYASNKNLLKIYVNKNTIGVYVNVVTMRSEEEILFLPGMKLGLISKPYYDFEIQKTIYECVLIGARYFK